MGVLRCVICLGEDAAGSLRVSKGERTLQCTLNKRTVVCTCVIISTAERTTVSNSRSRGHLWPTNNSTRVFFNT